MPKISVLMPAYNAEKYLQEAIDSILSQTYKDFEFLIINDGSTDHTEDIIKSYHDERIIYHKNEKNKGLVYSLNKSLEMTRGEYIARMDADDISLPERFKKQIEFMETHTTIGACCTNALSINIEGHITSNKWWGKSLIPMEWLMLFENPMVHPSMLIKKTILDEYNLLYDSKCTVGQDYDLWTRFILYSKMTRLDDALLLHRELKDSALHSNMKTAMNNSIISNEKLIENLTGKTAPYFHSYLTAFHGILGAPVEVVKIDLLKNWLDKLANILADKWNWDKKIKKTVKKDSIRIIISFIRKLPKISLIKNFSSFRVMGFHFYILLFFMFIRFAYNQIAIFTKKVIRKIIRTTIDSLYLLKDCITSFGDKRLRFNALGCPGNNKYLAKYMNIFLPFTLAELKRSHYKPSIIYYEPFGGEKINRIIRKKKNSKTFSVFFSGECVHSSVVPTAKKYYFDNCLNYVDISLGFDYIQSDNYIRYPLWVLWYFPPTKNKDDIWKKVEEFNNHSFQKNKFCSLIASHDITGIRTKLYKPITTIEQINCPSKFMHNDDSLHDEYNDKKYEYLKQFKFNLCPENDSYPGYVTEKIFDAFWADCIPIYHGGEQNPEPDVINPESFIFMNPENPQDAIEKIKELHTNEKAFNSFKKHKKLKDSAVDYIFNTMATVYDKFDKLILEKNIKRK